MIIGPGKMHIKTTFLGGEDTVAKQTEDALSKEA
jgi:hypothetical protein